MTDQARTDTTKPHQDGPTRWCMACDFPEACSYCRTCIGCHDLDDCDNWAEWTAEGWH